MFLYIFFTFFTLFLIVVVKIGFIQRKGSITKGTLGHTSAAKDSEGK